MTDKTAAERDKALDELGFYLEDRGGVWVVVDDCGGVRPSSLNERVLWQELQARASIAANAEEPLVRYCPGCGSVGKVEKKYRGCCPDGAQARMIPRPLAEKCHDTFQLAIRELTGSNGAANVGSDGVASLPIPGAQEAVAWPTNAAEAREFIGSHMDAVRYHRDDAQPHDDDKYTLSAHDLLSAFRWWAEFAAPQPALSAGWVMVPVEPTEAMKVAAVKYANGPAVYKNVGVEVLRIEEGIYGEVFEAMIAAAPPLPPSPSMDGESNG